MKITKAIWSELCVKLYSIVRRQPRSTHKEQFLGGWEQSSACDVSHDSRLLLWVKVLHDGHMTQLSHEIMVTWLTADMVCRGTNSMWSLIWKYHEMIRGFSSSVKSTIRDPVVHTWCVCMCVCVGTLENKSQCITFTKQYVCTKLPHRVTKSTLAASSCWK